jgi:hypothetical protein
MLRNFISMGHKRKEGFRIAATLSNGMKVRFTAYAKNNEMKESEVIKESLRLKIKWMWYEVLSCR